MEIYVKFIKLIFACLFWAVYFYCFMVMAIAKSVKFTFEFIQGDAVDRYRVQHCIIIFCAKALGSSFVFQKVT